MDTRENLREVPTKPRRFRFTLRGLMLLILVLALATTVVVQTIRLREAEVHLEQLHAVAEMERARAIEALYAAQIAEARARLEMTKVGGANPVDGEP